MTSRIHIIETDLQDYGDDFDALLNDLLAINDRLGLRAANQSAELTKLNEVLVRRKYQIRNLRERVANYEARLKAAGLLND